jgi:hypothetical protein
VLDGELIFIPHQIPRQGVFARWGLGAGETKIELAFPGGTYGIRKRLMSADIISVAEAIPALLTLDPACRPVSWSVAHWPGSTAGWPDWRCWTPNGIPLPKAPQAWN